MLRGIARDQFPILEKVRYYNTCSMGAMSLTNQLALQRFTEDWNDYAGFGWNKEHGWVEDVEHARKNFAKLVGAKLDNIAFSFGNSVATGSITSSFDFKTKNEVIFSDLDFPSTPANLMALEGRNVKYKVVKSEDGLTVSADDYKRLMTDKTQFISVCDVISNTGFRIDRQNIIELAHLQNIPIFLDSYQSVGSIQMDVKKLDVDFMASGCLKWILGGFGISFLYVRDDWIDKLNPSSIGWYGLDSPFEDLFDKLRDTLHRPTTAEKFQFGTPYPVGAILTNSGMEMIMQHTVKKIEHYNTKLCSYLIDRCKDAELDLNTPIEENQRGHIINIKAKDASNVVKKLTELNYFLDMRAHGIRVSLHFYNNQQDVDQLIDEIVTTAI